MWIPPEDTDPVILHASTRKKIGVFGAISVIDGRFLATQADTFNGSNFLDFLKKLLHYRRNGRKMKLILDNARWHHTKLLKPWLKEHRDIIQLDFLPAYSPDLNHIERVWKLTRRLCTHNRYFPELSQLIEVVFDQFESWQKPNETLRRLCAII